ncbi:MAG: tRNA glutamyl-Q(34) synthetase GluQRS [Gammaproteobacteria bacterium]
MEYVGRFAPSPTGPLHMGSLMAAVASYLHARQAGGKWLVRIEDIDPPREMPGAIDAILSDLEALALFWDDSPIYQSHHLDEYREIAEGLIDAGLAYRCSCSRREIRSHGDEGPLGYRYQGVCRDRQVHLRDTSIRVNADNARGFFDDGLQGKCAYDVPGVLGDYVIFRSDGLPAYHLAVVVDDARSGITHIVRGTDLLELTGVQIHLQQTLSLPTPAYLHVPIIVNDAGQKLSKRTGAEPVRSSDGTSVALEVLRYLGLEVPRELHRSKPNDLWTWAVANWDVESLRGCKEVILQSVHKEIDSVHKEIDKNELK